jgi:hypothetical protein
LTALPATVWLLNLAIPHLDIVTDLGGVQNTRRLLPTGAELGIYVALASQKTVKKVNLGKEKAVTY